jgi:lysyl-tRNA synthetase class 2
MSENNISILFDQLDINEKVYNDRLLTNIYNNYEFEKTHRLNYEFQVDEEVSVAGRIIFKRDLGKLTFIKLTDVDGIFQISLDNNLENYNEFVGNLQLGDIIGAQGIIYKTISGELTLRVSKCIPLRKALLPIPDKHAGLQDIELQQRYRYLDLIQNSDQKLKIQVRQTIIKTIKNFLNNCDFIEVETPILQNIASGAAATPFTTHHNALNKEFFLRIAPELYLKQLLVAGYNKIYEIGKCFRNEGIDPTHLQEFTMLEFYWTYLSYEKLQNFAIDLLKEVLNAVSKIYPINYNYENIEKISYVDLLKKYGIDYFSLNSETMKLKAKELNLDLEKYPSDQSLLDAIYKKCCLANIVDPILVYNYPRSALSKPAKDERFSEQFQIIFNKQEIIKSCLEMNDPQIQYDNFCAQQKILATGDTDAVRLDMGFLKSLFYGMPPAGGLGMGIDRVACILTNSSNIRDTLLFPLMK